MAVEMNWYKSMLFQSKTMEKKNNRQNLGNIQKHEQSKEKNRSRST